MTTRLDAPLVVGAGPTGLSLAWLLLRQGIRATVVDGREQPSQDSRATALHARSLEVLGTTLNERLLAAGAPFTRGVIMEGARQLATLPLDGTPTRYPWVLGLSQSETERILREALTEAGVHVSWGVQVTDLEPESDAVRVRVHAVDEADFVAPWVIGCDGARSTVRDAAGIEVTHTPNLRWWFLADVGLDGDTPPESDAVVSLGRSGILAMLPYGRPGWRRLIALGPAVDEDGPRPRLGVEDYQRLIDERSARDVRIREHGWLSTFRVHEHIAHRYRSGRVLIAGDAAHAHSPLGGQGMNTGIQDAANLAWKLALVVRGAARETLLDSYDAERRPVAEGLVEATSRGTAVAYATNPLLVWARNRAIALALGFRPVRERARPMLQMLSVSYPDSPLVAGPPSTLQPGERGPLQLPGLLEALEDGRHLLAARPDPGLVGAVPDGTHGLADESLTDAVLDEMSLPRDGVVVLRPDGHVGLVQRHREPRVLQEWWRSCVDASSGGGIA